MTEVKNRWKESDLYDYINEICDIECSVCGFKDITFAPADYALGNWFSEGWRATQNRCYCPDCAKKKLKL